MTRPRQWINKTALLWVMDEAEIPDSASSTVSTALALARHVDEGGRGAHPGRAELARITRKSVSQVKRDLARLLELGVIVLGDQSLVAHIRADRRPTVYDMGYARGRTDGGSSTRHGASTGGHPRGVVDARGRTDGGSWERSTGVHESGKRGGMYATRKDPEKDPEKKRAGARSRNDGASAPARQRRDAPTEAPPRSRSKPIDLDTKARRLNDAARIARDRWELSDMDALEVAKIVAVDGYAGPEEWTEAAWNEAYAEFDAYRRALAEDGGV